MASDPRDYKLDLSTSPAPAAAATHANVATPAGASRPYLSIHFACCGVYQRIYRDAEGTHYSGRCPKCLRPVRFSVAAGGTASREFTVR
jgi:hypothetical protein